ncbi:MAG: hypothetical protein J6S21_01965 [Victivallales bacterium]|nr:hypothetical protein [Victivallales bacterium]
MTNQLVTFDRDCIAARADIKRLQEQRCFLEKRAAMMGAIRRWFAGSGFLEVESPVRLPAPALEDYIDAVDSGSQWLRTSPELHLKRLLAAGYERIYEIGPCFRANESGDHHRTEFTMLEWYRRGDDWRQLMADAHGLFDVARAAVAPGAVSLPFRGHQIELEGPWDELTVTEAFDRYASCSLREAIDKGEFETILCFEVEPNLGIERPLFLTEYPVECSGLSAFLPGKPGFVARWELYVAGLEIGNACTELVDPPEQERRFIETAKLRAADKREVYPMDQPFMNAVWNGIKPSAGTAIGLDRMAMVLTNATDIAQVRAF